MLIFIHSLWSVLKTKCSCCFILWDVRVGWFLNWLLIQLIGRFKDHWAEETIWTRFYLNPYLNSRCLAPSITGKSEMSWIFIIVLNSLECFLKRWEIYWHFSKITNICTILIVRNILSPFHLTFNYEVHFSNNINCVSPFYLDWLSSITFVPTTCSGNFTC